MKKSILMLIVGIVVGLGLTFGVYYFFFRNETKVMECPECEKCTETKCEEKECPKCEEKECPKCDENKSKVDEKNNKIIDLGKEKPTFKYEYPDYYIIWVRDNKFEVDYQTGLPSSNYAKKNFDAPDSVIGFFPQIYSTDGYSDMHYVLCNDGSIYVLIINYDDKNYMFEKISGDNFYVAIDEITYDHSMVLDSHYYGVDTNGKYHLLDFDVENL